MEDAQGHRPGCDEPWIGDLGRVGAVRRARHRQQDPGRLSQGQHQPLRHEDGPAHVRPRGPQAGHYPRAPGAGKIQIGETEYEGKPGSLYYMPAGMYHALTSTDDLVFLLNLFR